MKKQQLVLGGIALLVTFGLYFFANTKPPKKSVQAASPTAQHSDHEDKPIEFDTLLQKAKLRLSPTLLKEADVLQQNATKASTNETRLTAFKNLASFWKLKGRIYEPYAYYNAMAAKLENSEKSLTFAAHQFLDNLMVEANPAMQQWLASNAKVLFEQALKLNSDNDSTKIGLGACYILGYISNNPMQGILPVKQIADANPKNVYAQFILGLGGKKSGQYDKAIERFSKIVAVAPDYLEAKLHLAECYDLQGNKANAIQWYEAVKAQINNPDARKELEQRIETLKK